MLITQFALAEQPLRMAMADYPPFNYYANGQYQGEGYQLFVEVMAELKQPYSIQLVPNYGRVLNDLQQQNLDGFFLATESAERNALAVLSEPLLNTIWSWVWLCERTDLTPGQADFKQQARVAAHTNSNIHLWLQEQGYQALSGTHDIRGLFALLDYKRVDALMMPQDTAESLIKHRKNGEPRYRLQPHIQLPFGIYLGKHFIEQHPDFMDRLNQAIVRRQRLAHVALNTEPNTQHSSCL